MHKFKQVFEISAALVKKQVINQGKVLFFSCVTLRSSMRTHPRPLTSVTDHHKNTKTHPLPKHDIITERPFNGFFINLQDKKQVQNEICY